MSGLHTANKAIILAAGFGKRLRPITDETPKPLIEINGKKMIETIIDGFIVNGITDIYVVVGHLKEQFDYLPKKYRQCKLELIVSPYYETCNNITSLYVAREHLGNCVITDGDFVLYNSEILKPQFDVSGYSSVWVDETNEWFQTIDKDEIVTSCSQTGGRNGWELLSVSFWSEEDGEKLKHHLEEEFKRGNTSIFWDDIPMFSHAAEYRLKIRKINRYDIVEIDSLKELFDIDSSYEKYYREDNHEKRI